MPRSYHVKGTRTFLVVAVVLYVLSAWCIKDGWFPSDEILREHPVWNAQGRRDSFYFFNKSLGVISFIGATVCAYIHRVVR